MMQLRHPILNSWWVDDVNLHHWIQKLTHNIYYPSKLLQGKSKVINMTEWQ